MKLTLKKKDKGNVSQEHQEDQTNPYLNEQNKYSSLAAAKTALVRTWQLIGLFSLFLVAIAIGSVTYLGNQAQFKPYIVEVDSLGDVRVAAVLNEATRADERIIRKALADWITALYTVTVDTNLQGNYIRFVYSMLGTSDPARAKVDAFYQDPLTNPFNTAEAALINVQIHSVLPLTNNSWQVDWTQVVSDKEGGIKQTTRYRATVVFYVGKPPSNDSGSINDAVLNNPLGYYIKDFSIVRVGE